MHSVFIILFFFSVAASRSRFIEINLACNSLSLLLDVPQIPCLYPVNHLGMYPVKTRKGEKRRKSILDKELYGNKIIIYVIKRCCVDVSDDAWTERDPKIEENK